MDILEKFEKIIKMQGPVLYLKGLPGIGKSAVMKAIAKKNGWNLIDKRLSQVDSSEIIGYPQKTIMEDGISVMEYAIPKWAYLANQKPTLVFFDELNRAVQETHNAALQYFIDRQIGDDFKFNNNVYFAAAGNLGEEDGCEVNEFDNALKGRLISMMYNPTIDEWCNWYANDNVNDFVISFIKNNPTYFYKTDDKSDAYASPRSWTFLSDLFGGKKEKNIRVVKNIAEEMGVYYVGPGITRFIRYLDDLEVLNINDIVNNYDKVAEKLATIARDKMNELVKELEKINLDTLDEEKFENVVKFLEVIHPDERISFFFYIVKNGIKKKDSKTKASASKNTTSLITKFRSEFDLVILGKVTDPADKKAEVSST